MMEVRTAKLPVGETDTKLVILALGANVDAEENIYKALGLLQAHLASMHHSHPVWTAPIGLQSEDFLNCVVQGQCDIEFEELCQLTKEIEQICGNTIEKRKKGEIVMDIDILQYGGKKYHRPDWKRLYIREGLKELIIAVNK